MGKVPGAISHCVGAFLCCKKEKDETKIAIKRGNSLLRPNVTHISKHVLRASIIMPLVLGVATVIILLAVSILLLANPAGTIAVASAGLAGAGTVAATASTATLTALLPAAIPLTACLPLVIAAVPLPFLAIIAYKLIRPQIKRGKYLRIQIEKLDKRREKLEENINESVGIRDKLNVKVPKHLNLYLKLRGYEEKTKMEIVKIGKELEKREKRLEQWRSNHPEMGAIIAEPLTQEARRALTLKTIGLDSELMHLYTNETEMENLGQNEDDDEASSG